MKRSNEDIRELIQHNGLCNYQVAEKAGYSEGHFCKLLRSEFDQDKRLLVINAIHELIREREEVNNNDRSFSGNGYFAGNDVECELYNNVRSSIVADQEKGGKLMGQPLEVVIDTTMADRKPTAADINKTLQNMLLTLDTMKNSISQMVDAAIE